MRLASMLLMASVCAACMSPARRAEPVDDFLTQLRAHCGKAYAGRISANEPTPVAADPFEGRTLLMHVRECRADSVRIPFHVGDDRSRTWVLSRTADGLQLKHDHRHRDGSADVLTWYGGDSRAGADAQRVEFPADAESIALFQREGLDASVANVWVMQVDERTFAYELRRPGRRFRVEFDLERPLPAPPQPW